MEKYKWFKGDVSFEIEGEIVEFSIIHNIPHNGNIDGFMGAFQCWLAITKDYTAESFIDYINSKPGYKAAQIDTLPTIIKYKNG